MKIPDKFKCAGFTINIDKVDKTNNNNYGNFCDATNTIEIADYISVEGKDIALNDEQKLNTFFHELIHVFQFYHDNSYSESQAQVYANFLQEFFRTKE